MAGELQEFADATLGLAINTKLQMPIPVGSGYAGRVINALGAAVFGTGQVEMSEFYCLGPFATGIPALDAVILMDRVGPEPIIIYDPYIGQSTIVIGGMMDHKA